MSALVAYRGAGALPPHPRDISGQKKPGVVSC
jgi:hypothetical protein